MTSQMQLKINNVMDEIDRLYYQAGSKADLSNSAFDILYVLASYGDGCSQKELCERCWTGKQTVNSAVKKMASQGFLVLEPGHGREKLIWLTESGKALIEKKMRPFLDAEQASYDVLSEQEKECLLGLLTRMRDGLRSSLASSGLL